MASKVSIRNFDTHEWAAYRDLRLRALADAADAFASTLAGEQRLSDAEWAGRLAPPGGSASYTSAVAEANGRAVGLAYGRIESALPDVAHLYSMWVEPEMRRSGVGRALADWVVTWARSEHAKRLVLQVTEGNEPAFRLYEKVGFVRTQAPAPLRAASPLLVQTLEFAL